MTDATWTVVEPSLPALAHTYSFGPGIATSLAFPGAGGGMVVVSAPCNPTDALFADLEKHGPVRALVAPNGYHNMGIAPWKARYPDAAVFAPAQSIARVSARSGTTGIKPLAEAAPVAGDRVELVDMPHYKTGEVLVRWPIDGGWAWYLTDVAMNINSRIPGLFGAVFRWTKSAPGFRRNAIAGWFMIKDKRALYAWLKAEAEKKPPKLVLMCHGDHVRPSDPVAEVGAAFT
jgi:hypothetical protein